MKWIWEGFLKEGPKGKVNDFFSKNLCYLSKKKYINKQFKYKTLKNTPKKKGKEKVKSNF
jgi:hypothetical protein